MEYKIKQVYLLQITTVLQALGSSYKNVFCVRKHMCQYVGFS